MSDKVLVFTDASSVIRLNKKGPKNDMWRNTFGWLSVDLDTLQLIDCKMNTEENDVVTSGEIYAILSAVFHSDPNKKTHIFTDYLSAVQLWEQIKEGREFDNKIYESIRLVTEYEHVTLHHIPAHRGYFFNSLIDRATRYAVNKDFSEEELRAYFDEACRIGRIPGDKKHNKEGFNRDSLDNPKNTAFHTFLPILLSDD